MWLFMYPSVEADQGLETLSVDPIKAFPMSTLALLVVYSEDLSDSSVRTLRRHEFIFRTLTSSSFLSSSLLLLFYQ